MVTASSGGLIKALAKIENEHATENVNKPDFEMHYPVSLQILIAVSILIFAAFAVLGIFFVDVMEGKIVCGSFFGFLGLVALICVIIYRHWKLKFDDYGLVYTPGFGSARELTYNEILSVKESAGSLLLKTEDANIRIPYYAIGLNIFLWRLEKEHFEIEHGRQAR